MCAREGLWSFLGTVWCIHILRVIEFPSPPTFDIVISNLDILAAAVDIIEAPGYRRWYVGILVHGGVAGPAGFWPPQPFCLLLTLYIIKHQEFLQEQRWLGGVERQTSD